MSARLQAIERLRAILRRGVPPPVVPGLDPRIRQLVRDRLEEAIERGALGLIAGRAVPLPRRMGEEED